MNEKYIFISYAHKDSDTVVPIIKALSEKYNIWYDDGIEVGSEWPEYIAEKLYGSDTVVAFISDNALASHNCKREINYALSKNKDMIIVYLEEVKLSRGMEMQLGGIQAVYYEKFDSTEGFVEKLTSARLISDCLIRKKTEKIIVEPREDVAEEVKTKAKTKSKTDAKTKIKTEVKVETEKKINLIVKGKSKTKAAVENEAESEVAKPISEKGNNTSGSKGLEFTILSDKKSCSVKIGECTDVDVVIPELACGGKPVVEISDEGFCNSNIQSIVVPSSVKKIGRGAFFGSEELQTVELNVGLEEIGERAFTKCNKLKKIIIPQGVITLGTIGKNGKTPFDFSGVRRIYIPKTVKTMKNPVGGKNVIVFYEGARFIVPANGVKIILNAKMPEK